MKQMKYAAVGDQFNKKNLRLCNTNLTKSIAKSTQQELFKRFFHQNK